VLDPRGRQMTISCGCALLNARVSLAADGIAAAVSRLPDELNPTYLARITAAPGAPNLDLARLAPAIEVRRTNRREFSNDSVPAEVLDALAAAARQEHAELHLVERREHRASLARLTRSADAIENADPAYRAELRAWTTDDPCRPDGVPAFAVPYVAGTSGDDVPIRDFDARGTGWLPAHSYPSAEQTLLLLTTPGDSRRDWLHAGEALEHVLLTVAALDYAASPFTSLIELARTRDVLMLELGLYEFPHVLLRVGQAPPTPPTNRRALADMLVEPSH
jgi:hypothetical protein